MTTERAPRPATQTPFSEMKSLIPMILAVVLGVGVFTAPSCKAVTPEELAASGYPEEVVQAQQTLLDREAAIMGTDEVPGELEMARAGDDPVTVAELEAELESVQGALAQLEVKVIRDRFGVLAPAVGVATGGGSLPWQALFAPLLPLLSRRGRKHYWNAVKRVNPFPSDDPVAGGGISPINASLDVLRAWGFLHSSDASKAAAEQEEPAPEDEAS